MGLDGFERFHRYHRVLSRVRWSSLEASRILLGLLLDAFVGEGRLIVGIDETLEALAELQALTVGPFGQAVTGAAMLTGSVAGSEMPSLTTLAVNVTLCGVRLVTVNTAVPLLSEVTADAGATVEAGDEALSVTVLPASVLPCPSRAVTTT